MSPLCQLMCQKRIHIFQYPCPLCPIRTENSIRRRSCLLLRGEHTENRIFLVPPEALDQCMLPIPGFPVTTVTTERWKTLGEEKLAWAGVLKSAQRQLCWKSQKQHTICVHVHKSCRCSVIPRSKTGDQELAQRLFTVGSYIWTGCFYFIYRYWFGIDVACSF